MLLEVGRVTRAHGLRGEVVVDLYTPRHERLRPGAVLADGHGRRLEVLHASPHLGRWIVAFAGVEDRTAAEQLQGAVLVAEEVGDDAGADILWVHRLVGAEVVDTEGRALGTVTAVEANPASDLLVLDGGALVPLRFVVATVPGRLTVDLPDGLLDL